MEIFKDIIGYEGRYQISNYGNVKSLKKNIILKGGFCNGGYHNVSLINNLKKQKTESVHRLVAIAFLDNIYKKRTVNHIDGNKKNNNIENLEWSTYCENMKHSFDIGLRKIGAEHPMARKMIDISNGIIFNTLKDAAI